MNYHRSQPCFLSVVFTRWRLAVYCYWHWYFSCNLHYYK